MRHTFFAPNDYRLYLQHYGVKGMKWGVRKDRYVKSSYKKANAIYNTLTDQQKRFVTGTNSDKPVPKEYVTKGEYRKGGQHLYGSIEQDKGLPVSVIDLWSTNGGLAAAVSIATRNDPKYLRKGYADRAVERGLEWFNSHPEIEYMVWGVNVENTASIELAKKHGFEFCEEHYGEWTALVLDRVPESD